MTIHDPLKTKVPAEVVVARKTDLPEIIGHARSHALCVGALTVACATAPRREERASLAAEMARHVSLYAQAIAVGRAAQRVPVGMSRIPSEREAVLSFGARIAGLPPDGEGLDRAEAVEIARLARETALPAFDRIREVIEEDEILTLESQLFRTREKAAMVEGILTEMGRIGRMIGLISINASVEAARAGGESGRAFQIIADEVRNLARQSADLVARMQARMIDGDDAPR